MLGHTHLERAGFFVGHIILVITLLTHVNHYSNYKSARRDAPPSPPGLTATDHLEIMFMADEAHTPDWGLVPSPCIAMERRGFLASGLVAAVVAGATIPAFAANASDGWNRAKRKYERALAEERAYVDGQWTPALHKADASGGRIPDPINDRMERLMATRDAAEQALIQMAAPTLAAVIWKMEHAHKTWEDFTGWPDDWWRAIMRDLRSFAEKYA